MRGVSDAAPPSSYPAAMTTPSDSSSGSVPVPGPGSEPGGAPPPGWGPPPGWEGHGQPAGYGQSPGYGAPAGYGQGYGPRPGAPTSEETTWALLAHLSLFVAGLVAPLVIYLVKKDTSPYVRQQAAEALNFHITLMLAGIASVLLMLLLIGFLLIFVVAIGGMVLAVIAAIAASKGEPYRYPLTLRLVS
jgi:uncharacterized protein